MNTRIFGGTWPAADAIDRDAGQLGAGWGEVINGAAAAAHIRGSY